MSRVSLIIPFYNCPYIDQAIESALNQTYEDVEIIVVNDGSTEFEKKIDPYLERIRYIKKGNGGTATALNLGIRNATGDYFTWLSSDDLYDRDKITKQISFMETKKVSASYTSYFLIDENSTIYSQPARLHFPDKMSFYQRLLKGCHINGCTVMLRMDVLKQIGLFDPALRYTHDYDMWLRVLPQYDFHYLDEPIVMHRVHGNMGTKRFQKSIDQEIEFVKKKHRPVLNWLISREGNK